MKTKSVGHGRAAAADKLAEYLPQTSREQCQVIAQHVVAAFLEELADGPPRYVPCRHPDGRYSSVWIAPHDFLALASTVKA